MHPSLPAEKIHQRGLTSDHRASLRRFISEGLDGGIARVITPNNFKRALTDITGPMRAIFSEQDISVDFDEMQVKETIFLKATCIHSTGTSKDIQLTIQRTKVNEWRFYGLSGADSLWEMLPVQTGDAVYFWPRNGTLYIFSLERPPPENTSELPVTGRLFSYDSYDHTPMVEGFTQPYLDSIDDLLVGENRRLVPFFQRPYCWDTAKDLKAFFESWDTAIERHEPGSKTGPRATFFGAMVMQPAGSDYRVCENVIDGQQRIITLYLTLLAAAEMLQSYSFTEEARGIIESYLIRTHGLNQFKYEPAVIPTIADLAHFKTHVNDVLEPHDGLEANWDRFPVTDETDHSVKLDAAWTYIRNELLARFTSGTGQAFLPTKFGHALNCLLYHFCVIRFALSPEEDALTVFDRLNSLGVQLTTADLIRSRIFIGTPPAGLSDAVKFRNTKYRSFEDSFRIKLGKDRDEVTNDNRNKNLDAFFLDFARIITEGAATKATAPNDIIEFWKEQKLTTPQQRLDSILEYAPYGHTWLGDIRVVNSRLDSRGKINDRQLKVLQRLVAALAYYDLPASLRPLITLVLKTFIEDKRRTANNTIAILAMIESFMVRRRLTGNPLSGVQVVVKRFLDPKWKDTDGEPVTFGDFHHFLKGFNTRDMDLDGLDDDHIRTVIDGTDQINEGLAKYILYSRDRFLRRDMADTSQPHWSDSKFELEHILPQQPDAAWSSDIPENEWPVLIPQIGNLTLISRTSNGGMGNEVWEEKRKEFKGSDFCETRELAAKKKWTKSQITKRTKDINKWILDTWPEPLQIEDECIVNIWNKPINRTS